MRSLCRVLMAFSSTLVLQACGGWGGDSGNAAADKQHANAKPDSDSDTSACANSGTDARIRGVIRLFARP
jgi:hypothetical protein